MTGSPSIAADCHVRLGVDLVRHQWDAVVLTALRDRSAQRRELRAALGDPGDKVLHEALGRLRARGLIGQSPDGAYALTAIGRSFACGPLLALAQWAQEHHRDVLPDVTEDEAQATVGPEIATTRR